MLGCSSTEGSDGWPLGLETVSIRVEIMDGITRSVHKTPFHLTTPSFSSFSSSDIDTESTVSFFPDRSITLGNLMGMTPKHNTTRYGNNKIVSHYKTQMKPKNSLRATWRLLIGCIHKDDSDVDKKNSPTLRDLLEAQRRASVVDDSGEGKPYISAMYEGYNHQRNAPPLLLGAQSVPSTVYPARFGGRQ